MKNIKIEIEEDTLVYNTQNSLITILRLIKEHFVSLEKYTNNLLSHKDYDGDMVVDMEERLKEAIVAQIKNSESQHWNSEALDDIKQLKDFSELEMAKNMLDLYETDRYTKVEE